MKLFNKYQYDENFIEKRCFSHHCVAEDYYGEKFWVKWIPGIDKNDIKLRMMSDMLRRLQGAKHACLPEIVDYGYDDDNHAYAIVYNYIADADSLENKVKDLSRQVIMSGLIDLAECLNHLYTDDRIFHGDIHPENILVNNDGQFFLIDFQLAEATNMLSEKAGRYTRRSNQSITTLS